MRLLPAGDGAVLAEYDSLEEAMGAFAVLERSAGPDVVELVPAARTVLVRARPGRLGAVRDWVRSSPAVPPSREAASADVVLRVRYDGPDLADAAAALGWSSNELVRRHTAAPWTSAFVGFAPGFAYLVSPDLPGPVPRRATSRPEVPAGAVGLAGEFSGVYPRSSPGGWQLIGRTDAELWDERRDPPALLSPGAVVRFEEAR